MMRICATAVLMVLYALSGTVLAIDLPSVSVDKLEDDFGDVHVGRKVEKRFVVTNTGNAPLAIESIETTCGCTSATAEKSRLDPGEKTEIAVSYDTTDLSAGKKTQAVKIHTNVPKQAVVSIRLYANIVRDVVLEPESLVARLAPGQNPIGFSVLAKNNSDKPVSIHVARTRGAVAKAVFQPEQVQIDPKKEQRFSVQVFLTDPAKGNFFRGAVFVATDHPTEKDIILPCLIRVVPEP